MTAAAHERHGRPTGARLARRRRITLTIAVGLLVAAFAFWWLCFREERYAEHSRPDGRYRIVVYRNPSLVAMPGQASDSPGRAVLEDSAGKKFQEIRLEMVQDVGPLEWGAKSVSSQALFDWPLPD